MILKEQDDRIADVEALNRPLKHPQMDERSRRRIKEQIRNLESGDLGESQAAYLLKVNFGLSPNWMIINDLRIEHEGLVAQIDHLLINRLLEFWVCESKRFYNGVKINDQGEFITFRDRIPRAAQSPIEQNARHLTVLKHVIDAGTLKLPTRLGFRLKPQLKSLILISGGTIKRPRADVPGIDRVIMADQVKTHIDRAMDTGNPFDLAKLVSPETLHSIGQQMMALHRPIQFDWERRFKLGTAPSQSHTQSQSRPPPQAAPQSKPPFRQPAPPKSKPALAVVPIAPARAEAQLACQDSAAPVTKGVAQFCKKNSERFRGHMLCMVCQARRAESVVQRILE